MTKEKNRVALLVGKMRHSDDKLGVRDGRWIAGRDLAVVQRSTAALLVA